MKLKILGLLAAGLLSAPMLAIAAPVQWSGNGHYYEFVSGFNTWTNARAIAGASTHSGLAGYLATVTSQAENDFIFSLIACSDCPAGGWIGGSDSVTEGKWLWADGPDAGQNFWNGDWTGSSPSYANWDAAPLTEPNGGISENYASLTTRQGGRWNDLPDNSTYTLTGYFVEYSHASTVPEPSGLALACISLVCLAALRRLKTGV